MSKLPYLIGVTGTNGKTSVTSFTSQLLRTCGIPAAAVGQRVEAPSGVRSRCEVGRGSDAIVQHAARLCRDGVAVAAYEVYSAAVARGAHRGVPYDAVAFTNLTPDHICVHGSWASYREAKLSFLQDLSPGTPAVLDPLEPGMRAVAQAARDAGLALTPPASEMEVPPFSEAFMHHNSRMAWSLARLAGASETKLHGAVRKLTLPPGRMVRRCLPNGALVVVDFAHNEGGLRAALEALLQETAGRVILVFGSKGGWGASKRAALATVAAALADLVVVTDDDPRTEDPAIIRAQLCHDRNFFQVPSRPRGIAMACRVAGRDDTVLVAGRGEDPYTVEAFGRRSCNDLAVVESICCLPLPSHTCT